MNGHVGQVANMDFMRPMETLAMVPKIQVREF